MTTARLLIGTALVIVAATPAMAQLRATDYTNSVLIDLSQIENLAPQRLGGNAGLLPPPSSAPTSRLLNSNGASRALPVSAPAAEHAARPARVAPAPKKSAAAPAKPAAAPKATASVAPKAPAAPKSASRAVATPAQEAQQTARTESAKPVPPPQVQMPGMTLVGPSGPQPQPSQQSAAVAPQARVEPPAAPKAAQPLTPTPTPPAVELPKAPEPPAAPPAPPAAAAPPPPAPPVQTAAVQPRAAGPVPDSSEVRFAAGDANLSDDGKVRLDRLSDQMKANAAARLQLLAYAMEDGSPSKARRLSLSRALAVRSYLINKGVQSARIDVRALGDSVPSGDPNRVDLKILDR